MNDRRFSALQTTSEDVVSAKKERERERRSASMADVQPAPTTLAERCVAARYRATQISLILMSIFAVRHADLLRFIAQKESKCLELRSQLATEEAELLALKRKWERIVGRGFGGGTSASVSSLDGDASTQGAMLSGIKEGVQGVGRLLAQLGDLSAQGNESELGHTSNSSISTTVTSSSSVRLSQSSMSSLGMLDDDVPPPTPREKISPDALDALAKRHSISTAVRRRPYEPSSPSTPSPPILTPQTPLSASFASPPLVHAVPKLSRSHSTNQAQPRHQKRMSMASSGFPPASSIPGGSVAPLASWVDSVGKRLGQLNNPPKESQAQPMHKRASVLLSDASQSFFAALASPTRPSAPPTVGLAPPASPSLLDDDDALGDGGSAQWAGMEALSPERPKLTPTLSLSTGSVKAGSNGNAHGGSAKGSEADSEEWNW